MSALLFGVPGKLKQLLTRVPANNAAQIAKLDGTITSRAPADTAVSNAVLTPGRSALLDNLDGSISSVITAVSTSGTASVEFSSTQNWTVPAGVTLIYITAQAGGGGGGGSGISGDDVYSGINLKGSSGGSGGNSGQIAIRIPYAVSGGQTIGITVGGGGAGGPAATPYSTPAARNGNNGTNGSDSSVTIASAEILRVLGGTYGNYGVRFHSNNNENAYNGQQFFNPLFSAGSPGGSPPLSNGEGGSGIMIFGRNPANGGATAIEFSRQYFGSAGGGGGNSLRADGGAGAQGTQDDSGSALDGTAGTAGTFGSGGGGAGGCYASSSSANASAAGGAGGDGFVLIEF